MIIQYIILGLVIFFAALVPPILSPLGYSLTGMLLLEKANPRTLLIISVVVVTLSDIVIRVIQNHLIKKWSAYETLEKQKWFHRTINKINKFIREQEHINKASLRREKYIETRKGKIATFTFAIFCFLPVLADIIGIRLLYKKIKFPYFVIAVIIGKTISHGTFIFVGKSIFQLLHIVK